MSTNKKINTNLELIFDDITIMQVDAIVNAANSTLLGGGGVDGAIHRAAGPHLLDDCRKIVSRIGKLKAGDAVTTGAGMLSAKHVIHTVGPVWSGGKRGEDETLAHCYVSSLNEAAAHDVASIAFPSISTGAYRFPIEAAAKIAIETVQSWLSSHPDSPVKRVIFCLFSQRDYDIYASILEAPPPHSN